MTQFIPWHRHSEGLHAHQGYRSCRLWVISGQQQVRVSGVTPSKMRGGQPVTGLNLACEAVIEPPFSVGNVLVPPNFLSNLPNAAEYEAQREKNRRAIEGE